MVEDMLVKTNRPLAGYGNLFLFVVIVLIVGVCSILWGKPLQNLAYQWPFCERLRKEKDDFHALNHWF